MLSVGMCIYCTDCMYIVQLIYRRFQRSSCYSAFPVGQNNPKIAPSSGGGDSSPHLTHGSLGPPDSTPHLDHVSRFCTTDCILSQYFTIRRDMPLPETNFLPLGGSGP